MPNRPIASDIVMRFRLVVRPPAGSQEKEKNHLRGMPFPPESIPQANWLYLRFTSRQPERPEASEPWR
jgi:hypothetical protein